MTEDRPPLPGYWKFLWMFWMQPVTLHRRLKECGIERPGMPGWRLLYLVLRGGTIERSYLMRIVGVLAFMCALAVVILVSMRGGDIIVGDCASVFAQTVALGIGAGITISFATGVAAGAAGGIALGIAEVIAENAGAINITLAVAIGAAFGVTFGIVLSIGLGIVFGSPGSVLRGVIASVGGGVFLAIGFALNFGLVLGVIFFAALSLTFFLSAIRAPLYFFEAIAEGLCFYWENTYSISTIQAVPVLYHDLSYFPHPFLTRHILLTAGRDPELTRRVLSACAIAPGQRRKGWKALAQLQARELEEYLQAHRFSKIAELRGTWLPGVQRADFFLLGFAEAARYLASASITSIPFQCLRKLELAGYEIDALRNRLLPANSIFGAGHARRAHACFGTSHVSPPARG